MSAHAVVFLLGLVAWGGLALALGIAVGLTVRGRDRRVPVDAKYEAELVPDTDRFVAQLEAARHQGEWMA